MGIQELDRVALRDDLPQHGLARGDIGTVVMTHAHGQRYTIEFVTLSGRTIAVETLRATQVRPLGENEIASARALSPTP